MQKGYLVYEKEDSIKNSIYINWMIEEGKKKNLDIELVINNKDLISLKEIRNIDFIINRSRDYELAKGLEALGIRVFNKFRFCLLGNDKFLAYNFVEDLKIAYPKIYNNKKEILNSEKKIIVKPKSGHGGEGINLLDSKNDLDFETNVYQEFIEDYEGDIRFYIINNKVVNSVIRKPKNNALVSNFTKGGDVEIYDLKEDDEKVINKILENIEIDYGGIDFLLLKNGEILFNEFEDAVGSRMLSALNINNTMELFLNHIINTLK